MLGTIPGHLRDSIAHLMAAVKRGSSIAGNAQALADIMMGKIHHGLAQTRHKATCDVSLGL